jgi:hypothetical protein
MRCRPLFVLMLLSGIVGGIATPLQADTIRLKNGQTVVGKIVRYENRRFIIVYERASPETQAIIALDDIESVEFDGRPLPPGYGSPSSSTTSPPASTASSPRTIPSSSPGSSSTSTGSGQTVSSASRSSATGGGGSTGNAALARTVQVIARDDWTYVLEVRRGDRVRISARGSIFLGAGRQSTPAGIAEDDPEKLMPGRPTGALIAVIGDDNDDYIFIGNLREFVAQRSGKLYLGINEGDLSDNSGSYEAQVEVQRAP